MVKRGFSLLEVVVTMSIASLIMGLALPQIGRSNHRAREQQLKANLAQIRQAMDRMMVDTGCYPINLSDLTSNTAPATGFPQPQPMGSSWSTRAIDPNSWRGPYLLNIPEDPITLGPWLYSPVGIPNDSPVASSANYASSEGTVYRTW